MLSWEYPPLIVGGLGRHVDALSRALVAAGHDVRVVSRGDADLADGSREGVAVYRSALDPINLNFATETLLSWSQVNEHALTRAALGMLGDWRPDVIHAHDWLVAQTAITVSQFTGAPIVTTVHATEAGRNMGWLATDLNRGIHSLERWLTHSSSRVIVCSDFMRDEVAAHLDLPALQVEVIGNGIDLGPWRQDRRQDRKAAEAMRDQFAADGPLLVFAGRLMHAKGAQTAIAALPRLRRRFPGVRLVIAGTGPYEPDLREAARRVSSLVKWAGFLSENELAALFGAADVAVVPSLYEPFGLVALEAAACQTPLAVADTGGLRDLVQPGQTGLRFTPDDPASLASAVSTLLHEPTEAARMARRARRIVARDYSWETVARQTSALYQRITQASARN